MKSSSTMALAFNEENPWCHQELSPNDVEFIKGRSFKNFNMMIAIPTRGMLHYQVVTAWRTLMMPINSKIFHTFVAGFEVGEARNQAVESFLSHPELQYLMFFDDDILIKPESIVKLARGFANTDYDILGGIYKLKDGSGQRVAYRESKAKFMESITDEHVKEGEVIPVDIIGMGFTAIHKSVFKKLGPAPWFKTSDLTDVHTKASFTEDVYFCKKAKAAKLKIGAVTSIELGHLDTKTGLVY